MRVTLVSSKLAAGGAERVLAIMANHWAEAGWSVTIITVDGQDPFYRLHPKVAHVRLGVAGDSRNLLHKGWQITSRLKRLRGALRASRPHVAVSFQTTVNIATILAARGLGFPVIVSERVDPRMVSLPNRFYDWMRDRTYLRAAGVVMQSERAAQEMPSNTQDKITVIPNPVVLPPPAGEPPIVLTQPAIVAMGRLVPQKGFDLLLRAMARLEQRFPEWSVTVLGEGTDREKLEELRDSLGLEQKVRFAGTVPVPYDVLRQADLFVLPSRFEGFPNALCEAMACGRAVVAADCPSGPREVVRDRVDGLLVPVEDTDALASAMGELMGDADLRGQLGARATEITDRFSVDRVMGMWEALAERVISESSLVVQTSRTERQ